MEVAINSMQLLSMQGKSCIDYLDIFCHQFTTYLVEGGGGQVKYKINYGIT